MSRFQEEIEKMKQRRERTIKQIAVFVEVEAKLRAPVSTGNLRRSITHETQSDKAYIGTNVEYAPYVEFGVASKNIPAQPYLRPAIEENRDKIRDMIREGMSL